MVADCVRSKFHFFTRVVYAPHVMRQLETSITPDLAERSADLSQPNLAPAIINIIIHISNARIFQTLHLDARLMDLSFISWSIVSC